ncbi:head decoration protein [Maricaulis sp.]|uniref:head decoration protein n=2 Tax=Maricaulis sp. TaxID=1486257 RepID=UPI0032999D6C
MSLLAGQTYDEPRSISDVLKYELDPTYCRKTLPLLAGSGAVRSIAIGTILGLTASLAIAGAANAGNVGAGILSGVALKANAIVGDYSAECITESNGAAVFAVYDPDGYRLADAVEGVAYDNGAIAFTIGTDTPTTEFDIGDGFTISVTSAAGKAIALDLTAVDGGGRVAGVCLRKAEAADGADGRVAALVKGPAEVARQRLVYPSGATAAQKAAIEAQLVALGIHVVDVS